MQQQNDNTTQSVNGEAEMNRPEQGIKPMDVYDHCTQAREIFEWMEALSGAIGDASTNEIWGPYRAKRLAGLMHYLATDWSAHFDHVAEEIAKDHGFDHTQ